MKATWRSVLARAREVFPGAGVKHNPSPRFEQYGCIVYVPREILGLAMHNIIGNGKTWAECAASLENTLKAYSQNEGGKNVE